MAQPNSSVKVVEVCKVAPQPSSPDVSATPPPESLPLTLFDLPWLRFAPVERLFLYQVSHSAADILIPKLKFSLSIVLQQFPPLAGNITWPQHSPIPILSYVQGDAVSLTIAEYSNTNDAADHFHHLSSIHGFIEAGEYHPLVPQLSITHEKAAAMAIQVTIFPNRGFSIGTSIHHAVMDGKSSTLFIKLWANICKHGELSSPNLSQELKPCYDRMLIKDTAGLDAIYSNEWLKSGGPNNRSLCFEVKKSPLDSVRGTFELARAKIETIRQLVMNMMANKKTEHQSALHLSTFSLTCAYTWVCLANAEEIKSEKMLFIIAADCRSRLDPPLPTTYFGNCIVGRLAVAETKRLLGEDGLLVAITAISEAIKGLDHKTLLDGAETLMSRISKALQSNDRVLSVAGSTRLGLYDAADFGWGRPKKTAIVSIDRTGAISLSESKSGNGSVEIGLVLKKHQMEAFASLFAEGLGGL